MAAKRVGYTSWISILYDCYDKVGGTQVDADTNIPWCLRHTLRVIVGAEEFESCGRRNSEMHVWTLRCMFHNMGQKPACLVPFKVLCQTRRNTCHGFFLEWSPKKRGKREKVDEVGRVHPGGHAHHGVPNVNLSQIWWLTAGPLPSLWAMVHSQVLQCPRCTLTYGFFRPLKFFWASSPSIILS
jgi:hypothetical protein